MGSSNSKQTKPKTKTKANTKTKTGALSMCKERKKMIKEAMESRYALAASHLSYIQSLANIGVSLRRFAEAEVLIHSSLSPSASPSYPSPSPSQSHLADATESPPVPRLSYMRAGGAAATAAVTVRYNPCTNTHCFLDDEPMGFPLPPPPPPPLDSGSSWDYFDPSDQGRRFQFVGDGAMDDDCSDGVRVRVLAHPEEESQELGGIGSDPNAEPKSGLGTHQMPPKPDIKSGVDNVGPPGAEVTRPRVEKSEALQTSPMVEKDLCDEKEDPSEYITHRAKDFLSSIKDIENRFIRASESGKEVARMLEANKIQVGFADAKGGSSPSDFLAACPLACCRGKSVHASHEPPPQSAPRVIIWNRSTSSQSSSSRNPFARASKDSADDSGSECVEDLCMISGSHSSTLERLYAWERKLYDEVKASEVIWKEYDKKCNLLRHQFAKDLGSHVIDKTRAAVKDLHSRIRVALHAVDSISKRIERMRDEELYPQLTELIQGFIRMWKAMLECHHAQYITISLAYHARSSTATPGGGETHHQIMAQLQYEFECFGLSFADWTNSHTSFVEALNGWLQNCVMQPLECSRSSRRPFSPRRVLAPPIFVLCRDWSAGFKSLPSDEVSDAIRNFLSDLHHLMKQQLTDEKIDKAGSDSRGELQDKHEKTEDGKPRNLVCIHTSLAKVLDKLTKFSEASLKLYEDIRQKSEAARIAYSNPRPCRC